MGVKLAVTITCLGAVGGGAVMHGVVSWLSSQSFETWGVWVGGLSTTCAFLFSAYQSRIQTKSISENEEKKQCKRIELQFVGTIIKSNIAARKATSILDLIINNNASNTSGYFNEISIIYKKYSDMIDSLYDINSSSYLYFVQMNKMNAVMQDWVNESTDTTSELSEKIYNDLCLIRDEFLKYLAMVSEFDSNRENHAMQHSLFTQKIKEKIRDIKKNSEEYKKTKIYTHKGSMLKK